MQGEHDPNGQLSELSALKRNGVTRDSKIPLPDGAKRIIREDGTEVIKVRKRKRRNHQPKKEREKKLKRMKVILAIAALALLLATGIGVTLLIGYFNSDQYVTKLEAAAKKMTGAEVKMEAFKSTPFSAGLGEMTFDWLSQNGALRSLTTTELKFDYPLNSFFTGNWKGGSAIATQGRLSLQLNDGVLPHNGSFESDPEISFNRYIVQETNVDFGGLESWAAEGVRVIFEPSKDGKHIIHAEGGDFKTPLKSVYVFKTALLELSEDSPMYLNLSLQPKEDSSAELSLEGPLKLVRGHEHSFKMQMKKLPLEYWQYAVAAKFLRGVVSEGEGDLTYTLGDDESIVFDAKVNFENCTVSGWPFVTDLAQEMNRSYYMRPDFRSKAVAHIRSTAHSIEVTDIDFQEEFRMGIKGSYKIDSSQRISGKLEIGIPYEGLQAEDLKMYRRVFKKDDGMMIWTTVNLSGTLTNPSDDLGRRLRQAKENARLEAPAPAREEEIEEEVNPDDAFRLLNE